MQTVWVLGDQLNRRIGALADARPDTHRVLLVESRAKLVSKPWHVQRAHLVITSMRRFAAELRQAGYLVDYRKAASPEDGFEQHCAEHAPDEVVATEPLSLAGHELMRRLEVGLVRSNQFLCHYADFAAWAGDRERTRMEDFYRWQRRRLGYLMDGDDPVGGRWNYDEDNRQPPPSGPFSWPTPPRSRLDGLDREVLADLPDSCLGSPPDGTWATSRAAALARLRHFVDKVLPAFGPHEDAMVTDSWHLAHSLLSPYLNLGLLLPAEVCDAVQAAYDRGAVPINSAEGFIRQVIGWREYVWGLYWRWMPQYRDANALGAAAPLPPAYEQWAPTRMNCVRQCLSGVHEHSYNHHIQRLMVLGNLSLLADVRPWALTEWMWASFVDGAEWVMVPNVLGMSQWADGGRMATKPYLSGGRYIDRMSDYCKGCGFEPTKRVGETACPFTTLYWDFLARHADQLRANPRIARQVRAAQALPDLAAVRQRAADVKDLLAAGQL